MFGLINGGGCHRVNRFGYCGWADRPDLCAKSVTVDELSHVRKIGNAQSETRHHIFEKLVGKHMSILK